MLTTVKAYSELQDVPTLLLSEAGGADTDLIQIRNIAGLDPVKASVNTSALGAVDGVSHLGSSVQSRNIVLTLRPNPDWFSHTYSSLRKLIYGYFIPKRRVRLEFISDDMVTVGIDGIVEDVTDNMFSKDPEHIISIICPDPHFTAINGVEISSETNADSIVIPYNGSIEAGVIVKVSKGGDASPTEISIGINDAPVGYFLAAAATVDDTKYFIMSSLPLRKFIENVDISSEVGTSILQDITALYRDLWPVLQPGDNYFYVNTDIGNHPWQLTYYERYGGL